jgi:hypothetical protein
MSRFTEEEYAAAVRRNARPKVARIAADVVSPPAEMPTPPPPAKRNGVPSAAVSKAKLSIDTLLFQLQAAGLPLPEREYMFARDGRTGRPRRWRFDLAYPNRGLAIELEGLVFPPAPRWHEAPEHRLGGRHVSVKGFTSDIAKYAEAWSRGWSVLRILHSQIESGEALMFIERRLVLPTAWVPTS